MCRAIDPRKGLTNNVLFTRKGNHSYPVVQPLVEWAKSKCLVPIMTYLFGKRLTFYLVKYHLGRYFMVMAMLDARAGWGLGERGTLSPSQAGFCGPAAG